MLRRIAVHLDPGTNALSRFNFALNLAREFKAEIQCLYAGYIPPARHWPPYVYGGDLMVVELLDESRKVTQAEHDDARFRFMNAAAGRGIPATWFSAEHSPAEEVSAHARLSDLLIIGAEDKQDEKALVEKGFAQHLIFSSGRPVLVLPRGFAGATAGQKTLLCWDGSREAARALADAAPFLQRAAEVLILTVSEPAGATQATTVPPEELAAYCRTHSYAVSRHMNRSTDYPEVGQIITSVAAEEKVDLIVMGAYGHSRFREWVLGGATEILLTTSPMPVLFSH